MLMTMVEEEEKSMTEDNTIIKLWVKTDGLEACEEIVNNFIIFFNSSIEKTARML